MADFDALVAAMDRCRQLEVTVEVRTGHVADTAREYDTGVNPGVWTLIGQAPIPATRTTWRRSTRGLPRAR